MRLLAPLNGAFCCEKLSVVCEPLAVALPLPGVVVAVDLVARLGAAFVAGVAFLAGAFLVAVVDLAGAFFL